MRLQSYSFFMKLHYFLFLLGDNIGVSLGDVRDVSVSEEQLLLSPPHSNGELRISRPERGGETVCLQMA